MQIALILVPEFTLLPVTSVIDPLRLANRQSEKSLYVWTTHSTDGTPITASNGITLMPDGDLESIPDHATVIVCGGTNVQKYADKALFNWLRKAARKGTDIGAICTGAQLLAMAGLLDGYTCTIHWENQPGFME